LTSFDSQLNPFENVLETLPFEDRWLRNRFLSKGRLGSQVLPRFFPSRFRGREHFGSKFREQTELAQDSANTDVFSGRRWGWKSASKPQNTFPFGFETYRSLRKASSVARTGGEQVVSQPAKRVSRGRPETSASKDFQQLEQLTRAWRMGF